MGCARATGDVLVFVSAHVYPTHDTWLERLVAPFDDDHVALSYGRQRGAETSKFSEHQIFAKWFPNRSASPQRGYFCNNANCAVRRSDWENQPYDETLTGLEDLDWAKRVQAKGRWLVYSADATIIHVHDESWDQVANRYRREALAIRQIDEHARFTVVDFVRLLVLNVSSDWLAAARQGKLLREAKPILLFRYFQLRGTWRGHSGPPDISAELRQRLYFPVRQSDHKGTDDAVSDDHLIDYGSLLADKEQIADGGENR